MKNLRVAFCFSGQLRTWKHCYSSWLEFASKFQTPPDIFCHMWDFNSNTGIVTLIKKDSNVEKISNDEITEFLDIMKPKKYVIETFEKAQMIDVIMDDEMKKYNKVDKTMYWISNQFYSNMYSAFIKRDYEIENGFEYDMCFKIRYDMILSEFDIHILFNNCIKYNNEYLTIEKPQQNTIYSIHSGKLADWPFLYVGDVFYFSDSQTFDKISLFYYRLPDLFINCFKYENRKPEVYFYFYLKSIMCKHFLIACDPKIVRNKYYEDAFKSVNMKLYECDIIK